MSRLAQVVENFGARDRTRTDTVLLPRDFKSDACPSTARPVAESYPYKSRLKPDCTGSSGVRTPKLSGRSATEKYRPFNLSLALMLIRRKHSNSYSSMARSLGVSRQSIDRYLEGSSVTRSRRADFRSYIVDRLTGDELERCGDIEKLGL